MCHDADDPVCYSNGIFCELFIFVAMQTINLASRSIYSPTAPYRFDVQSFIKTIAVSTTDDLACRSGEDHRTLNDVTNSRPDAFTCMSLPVGHGKS